MIQVMHDPIVAQSKFWKIQILHDPNFAPHIHFEIGVGKKKVLFFTHSVDFFILVGHGGVVFQYETSWFRLSEKAAGASN